MLIAHSEPNVGESFALLLAMRGFEAVQIADVPAALHFARHWQPQVLFVDTLIGELHDHALARQLREALADAAQGAEVETQLMIALAADATRDPRDTLHDAAYDGFCRTPCPVWWLYDVLKCFYIS